MATKSMDYNHPTYITRQACCLKLPATAASTSAGKFVAFTAMKVKSIQCMVDIAGTSTGGYDIKNGTASVGQFACGTSLAATLIAQYATDITLASGGYVDFVTNSVGATLAASAMLEFEIVAGANVTS